MATKGEDTVDWVSREQLRAFKLRRLKRIRQKKRRELDRLDDEITELEKLTSNLED